MLKRMKESDTYVTHLSRHPRNRDSPEIRDEIETLWLTSAIDVDCSLRL
jgi:hypothetical protein